MVGEGERELGEEGMTGWKGKENEEKRYYMVLAMWKENDEESLLEGSVMRKSERLG
jgi:hypothetical protein